MTQAYQLGDLGQLLTVDAVGNNITLAANSVVVGNASVNATINSTAFTGTANNTSFVGTVSAANVVSNAQLTANLANYQTTAGLSANVATLSSNNASYLGGVAAASYVNTSGAYTRTGVTTFSANLIISTTAGISANGSFGTANQVLTSNGSTVYWSTVSGGGGGFTNGQSISVNNFVISGAFTANGSNGASGQYLISNGSATYWANIASNVRQIYTTNGSVNTFTVVSGYSANNLDVYMNGVKLQNGIEVSATNGSTFTILTNTPANGTVIEVVGIAPNPLMLPNSSYSGTSTVVSQQFTANGSANSFTVSGGYTAGTLQVYLNGVKQIPGVDVITTSGSTVNFVVTPANNYIIDVFGYLTSIVYSANAFVVGQTQIGINSITLGNTQINSNNITVGNTTIGLNSITSNGTANSYFMGSVGIGTSTPQSSLSISTAATTDAVRWTDNTNSTGLLSTTTGASTIWTTTALAFGTGAATFTERMRIDSSGNVGIGTSSPTSKLTVAGNLSIQDGAGFGWAGLSSYVGGSSASSFINFTTASSERMRIDSSGNVLVGRTSASGLPATSGFIQVADNIASGAFSIGGFGSFLGRQSSDGSTVLNTGQAGIIFSSGTYGSTTERMRIDSSGNLLVGTTGYNYNYTGNAVQIGSFSAGNAVIMSKNTTATTNMIVFNNPNGQVGYINTIGSSTVFSTSSDYRLKKNVQPMTTGLATIAALKPVTYDWKVDGEKGEGFIAHELQEIVPLAVSGEKDAVNEDGSIKPQGVDYSKIVVHLVAAIQELKAEFDAYKASHP